MMAGIHVSDAETMSLKATFPRFIDTERKYGSLTRGMIAARKARMEAANKRAANGSKPTSIFMTFKNGLQEMVTALEDAIHGEIITGQGVQQVQQNGTGYTLMLENGRVLDADALVLATPAYNAAELLRDLNADLAAKLDAIRYVSTATVSLGFNVDDLDRVPKGVGFVIPRNEPTKLLACTITSNKFTHRAGPGTLLLRVFIGGPRREEYVSLDDDTLLAMVREELRTILGITAEPTVARVFRWERGNPQYDVGHMERMDAIDALCPPGVYLTGSAYRGVGIPDCIRQGQETAAKIVERLAAPAAEPARS